jgi:putative phosphoribosyl transferase
VAHQSGRSTASRTVASREVRIPAGEVFLAGNLDTPPSATGIILFAHGSGSSRFSPRNRFVAGALHEQNLATLLMDLLTPEEEQVDLRSRHLRFDIRLLAERLVTAVDWVRNQPDAPPGIGLFGASTGGGAALVAAADRPGQVRAVVSRGGRPDLAGDALVDVSAPTLLIVGGNDLPVIQLNREAMNRMTAEVQLEIVPRASHLFEEPGALEQVAGLAARWFTRHLSLMTVAAHSRSRSQ